MNFKPIVIASDKITDKYYKIINNELETRGKSLFGIKKHDLDFVNVINNMKKDKYLDLPWRILYLPQKYIANYIITSSDNGDTISILSLNTKRNIWIRCNQIEAQEEIMEEEIIPYYKEIGLCKHEIHNRYFYPAYKDVSFGESNI